MICPRCHQETHRLIVKRGITACADCRGLSEAAGVQITGVLSRNSERVRAEQHTYEGDTILPHTFDPLLNKWLPNENFMQRFPDKITTYFTEAELKKAGYSKPDKLIEAKAQLEADAAAERELVEFVADDEGQAMSEVIEAVDATTG
jgi:hypothetical protein